MCAGDLIIFLVSMIYVINTLVVIVRLQGTGRNWIRIANTSVPHLVTAMGGLENKTGWGPHWKADLLPFVGERKFEDAEWKVLRLLFLRQFKLGREFDYSKYTQKKLITQIAQSLNVHPSTWGFVMMFCLCIYFLRVTAGTDENFDVENIQDLWDTEATNASVQNINITCTATETFYSRMTDIRAQLSLTIPILFGWGLCVVQFFVVIRLKLCIFKILRLKGCSSVAELPGFLLSLDAEVDMANLIPYTPMFDDTGVFILSNRNQQHVPKRGFYTPTGY
jgi:hypothetical protein